MEPSAVVDLVDETRKMFRNLGEALIGHWVDGLDLHGLHEALRFGVVVGVAAPAHRADQAVSVQGFAVNLSGVLRSSVGTVDAAGRRLTPLDGSLQSSDRQTGVDRAADGQTMPALRELSRVECRFTNAVLLRSHKIVDNRRQS